MKIIKQFKSRKNSVYLVNQDNQDMVMKVYNDVDIMINAISIMNTLRNSIVVPDIIDWEGNTLYMQYIDGVTLLELFERANSDEAVRLASLLCDYIIRLRNIGYVQSDCNFSNFIIHNICYGVDYDEIVTPSKSYDFNDSVADIILFACTYNGICDEVKHSFIQEILGQIDLDVNYYISRAKERLQLRRGKELNNDIDRYIV